MSRFDFIKNLSNFTTLFSEGTQLSNFQHLTF